MPIFFEIEKIYGFVKKERVAFKRHSVIRMHQRNISTLEVEEALLTCEIVEDYSEKQRLPSYLILGFTKKNMPLHIVLLIDIEDEMIWVVTVYKPTLSEWEEGFKKRRKC